MIDEVVDSLEGMVCFFVDGCRLTSSADEIIEVGVALWLVHLICDCEQSLYVMSISMESE